jgi:hypothetical protein
MIRFSSTNGSVIDESTPLFDTVKIEVTNAKSVRPHRNRRRQSHYDARRNSNLTNSVSELYPDDVKDMTFSRRFARYLSSKFTWYCRPEARQALNE